jgi:hypothetical protein
MPDGSSLYFDLDFDGSYKSSVGSSTKTTEAYIYDATNRLSVGVNDKGETSAYVI